jgi:hypothetical protein
MNFIDANMADLIGAFVGFVLTLFVFSYAWGDNPLFRFAVHLFIGVAAGYAAILTLYNVILPQLIFPFFNDSRQEMILAAIYLIPAALVLTKMSPRLSRLGTPSMAILVGVGAATAIGGAVLGTLFPQVSTSITLFDHLNIWNALFIVVGTLTTLIYFQFTTKKTGDKPTSRQQTIQVFSWIGQAFIAITFGALFAGVYLAALSALIERFSFLWSVLYDMFLTIF